MITHPRSSLRETKSSLKKSSFPSEMPVMKSVGVANRQSPTAYKASSTRIFSSLSFFLSFFLRFSLSFDDYNRIF